MCQISQNAVVVLVCKNLQKLYTAHSNLCYKNRKAPAIRMVDAFLFVRQKDSSKIYRKNFFNAVGCSCAHLIRVMDISIDDGFRVITHQCGNGTDIDTVGQ